MFVRNARIHLQGYRHPLLGLSPVSSIQSNVYTISVNIYLFNNFSKFVFKSNKFLLIWVFPAQVLYTLFIIPARNYRMFLRMVVKPKHVGAILV